MNIILIRQNNFSIIFFLHIILRIKKYIILKYFSAHDNKSVRCTLLHSILHASVHREKWEIGCNMLR